MNDRFIYQVIADSYEGTSEVIGTYTSLTKAKYKMKKAALAFQKECGEAPTREDEMGIYFINPYGYDFRFGINKVEVE